MPTSGEIAGMFQAQQAAFAQQNHFANNIGPTSPFGGIGAWGSSPVGGFQSAGAGFPGMGAPPPVFNYQPAGVTAGYGSGTRFAGTAMSAAGAVGSAIMPAIGIAGMLGVGGSIANALDPISGFMKGYGGMSARGIMGGLAGAAGPLALAYTAAQLGSSFMHGGHQQQMVQSQLGQFQHFNAASRTGQGFSRQDARDIGQTIRSLSEVPELMTSMEELTRLLPKMRQMGMMQGIRDASEFQTRFKEAIGTISKMAKYMGTTMEEATKFFEHSRSMGMFDRKDQLQNMINAQFTSGMTGMTMGETMQMQQGGAQMAQQFGARRRYGAQGVTNIAQRLALARENGNIEEGLIQDVTGLEGPAGDAAAAQKMYGFMMNLSRTAPGQAIIAGAMKRNEEGKVVLDEEVVRKVNAGQMSLEEIKGRAEKLSHEDKIAFRYQAANLGAQFAGKVDVAKFVSGLVAGKGQDAGKLVLQQLSGGSMSEADIELLSQLGGGGGRGADMDNMVKIQQREHNIAEQTDPSRIWKRLKTRMHASTFGHVEKSGAEFFDFLGKEYDSFIDDLVGRHVVSLSKGGAEAFRKAMTGGNDKEIEEMFLAAHGLGDRRDLSGVTTGRVLKWGVMGAAGLAAGVLSAGNPLAVGAAMTAAGLLASPLDSTGENVSDTEFGAWLKGDEHHTGRSAKYENARSAAAFGREGVGLDHFLSEADEGKYSKLGGEKAEAALRAVQWGVYGSSKGALADRNTTQAKKKDMMEKGIAHAIAAEVGGTVRGATLGGSDYNASYHVGELAALLDSEDASDREKLLRTFGVKSLEELADKVEEGGTWFMKKDSNGKPIDPTSSQKHAAALLRAAANAERELGTKRISAGVLAVTKQREDPMQVKLSEASSGAVAEMEATIANAQKVGVDAEAALNETKLNGDTKALLRSSSNARKLFNEMTAAPDKNSTPEQKRQWAARQQEIKEALMLEKPEEAMAALQKLGFSVSSVSELEAMKSAMGDIASQGGKATGAIGAVYTASKLADYVAIKGRLSEVGGAIAASATAAKGLAPEVQGQAVALGQSVSALAGSKNIGDHRKVMARIRDQVAGLTKTYSGLSEEGRKELKASLGPLGDSIAGASELAAGLKADQDDGKISIQGLMKQTNLSREEVLRATGSSGGAVKLTDDMRQRIASSVAAGKAASNIAVAGQSQTTGGTDQEMLKALNGIQRNSELQTTLLTVVASGKKGADAKTLMTKLLAAGRQNSKATASGRVDMEAVIGEAAFA